MSPKARSAAWQLPRPPSIVNPLHLGPRPFRIARLTLLGQSIGTCYLAGLVLLLAAASAMTGVRWLAFAAVTSLVGFAILGVSATLYLVMVGLGRFSRRSRLAAVAVEVFLAPAGFVMAMISSANTGPQTQGPFADGASALIVLLGVAFAVGGPAVVLCLAVPRKTRLLFRSGSPGPPPPFK